MREFGVDFHSDTSNIQYGVGYIVKWFQSESHEQNYKYSLFADCASCTLP